MKAGTISRFAVAGVLTAAYFTLACRPSPAAPPAPRIEFAMEIWDWVAAYRDIARFRRLVDDAAAVGFNTIELSVAWKDFEPRPGQFAWDFVDQRIRTVLDKRLALRVRINFSYASPWPEWANPPMSLSPDGRNEHAVMSIYDARLNALQEQAVRAVVTHWRGAGIEWCPVFGMHTEVKLGTWIGYEPPARKAFAQFLRGRYGSVEALGRAWGTNVTDFSHAHPPVPAPTAAEKPDLSAPSCDWIRFREEALSHKMAALLAAVRQADPAARTAVMLGESFRSGSAEMANLAYEPYSRTAGRVIHSYDFFWHKPDDLQAAALAVDIMRGITGKPVVLEIDGPVLQEKWGYRDSHLTAIGLAALDRGAAGLNVANYCYTDKPLREYPFLVQLGREIATRNAKPQAATSRPAAEFYYVSKWANYVCRGPDESLHDRQFAPYLQFLQAGRRMRIISDDNLLSEDVSRAAEIYVAPAPALDSRAAARLRALSSTVRLTPAGVPSGAALVP
ncbi:MAG: beta-galactosidase [Planctomycetota bacterium]|nr:beta-galactosidase [Planctomycetota bacterium]